MKLAKTLLIAPLVAGTLITSCFAAADSQDDVSYSVGYTMGQTLKNQMDQNNIATDNQEMVDGLKDGIIGKQSKLTPDQMQNAMIEFQKQAMAAQKK
ncbi:MULTISPECIES: infectivity potentiator lipoprotein FipA [Francisella]|uniref:Phage infection protein n=1 Tax=Francisella opportunistica TaxID=2016517 RepID=A0A345JRH0_9GAMM|nr:MULTISPECIES: FKBP-type peptidyl-prolyl cis-trans isomerase N-terminal domain-containing protein [Francisella]APC91645.1 FKBP-type peptidyl-prolyl cis-trans isomerase FkpA precursor [Francisella sp. MA067296]AXH29916.1 phage infection protein [Francisella opportunistica]AXH31563.1 phage infection protein [Francisella opportunistica]AXH33211.1 phage infection protein [Francisella opportunistica]